MNIVPTSLVKKINFEKHVKLFLSGILTIIVLFILGIDYFSLVQLRQTEQMLQQLQIDKEKTLMKNMEKSAEQKNVNLLRLLNRSNVGFTLANLCENSKLWMTKIELAKPRKKITENTFDVSLDLSGDYFSLMKLIDKLAMLSWNINVETLHITLKNSKTANENFPYPLKIKLKLAIENYYLPRKVPTSLISVLSTRENSPFVIKRYVGKLIYNQKTFPIIDIGHDKLNI